MANPYTRLARQLADVRSELRAAVSTPQLAYSSIENGSLDEYDGEGNLVQIIGQQWDGTHGAYPVTGPVPPKPTSPVLTGGLGLTIGWDGTFANDAGEQDITITAPMDWSRVELHVSKVSGFAADTADTLVDSIESPRGGSRPALVEPGTWYAVLVSRSLTGKRSVQSAEASAVVVPPVGSDVDVDALRDEFTEATNALQRDLAANAAELLTLTEGPLPDSTAENIADAAGKYLSLTTDQLIAGSANIGTGVADKFYAGIFASNKIYGSQVVLGAPGNLLPDPGFNDAEMTKRRNTVSTCTVAISSANDLMLTNSTAGLQYLRPYGSAQTQAAALAGEWIPVMPGDVYLFTFQTSAWKAATGWAQLLGRSKDGATTTNIGRVAIAAGASTVTVEGTIPPNVYWMIPEVAVPGGGASYILRNTMSLAQKITPSLIVAGLIDGQRVVGASIESNAAANRGVKLTDAGLFAFDSSGKETVRLDGANSILTGATIRTAASGARWQMSTAGLEAWNAKGERYLLGNDTGLEMIGSVSSKGKTVSGADINVRLTTITRNLVGDTTVVNPGLVFDLGTGVLGDAPGVYSPDGSTLYMSGLTTGIAPWGSFSLSREQAVLDSQSIRVGDNGLWPTTAIELLAKGVTLGYSNIVSGNAKVSLLGNIDINGNPLFGPWINLPLLNGWKITNSNKTTPAYRLNGDTVEFKGSISGGTSNVIALLPAAYRAKKEENKVVPQYNSGWVTGSISVAPDGYVRLDTYSSSVYSVNLDFTYSIST